MNLVNAARELASKWRAKNLVEIEHGYDITLADEADLQLLTDALLAMAPVVEAAQAWRRSSCDRLAGCEAGAHDPDCSDWKAEYAIACAVDKLGGTP